MEIRTKKITIASLIVLILISGLVYFLLNKNSQTKKLSGEDAKITSEELEADFVRKISEREKPTMQTNRPVEPALLPEQCNSIKAEEDKKLCLEYIDLLAIIEKLEIEKCETLSTELADVCIYETIVKKRSDFKMCSEIKGEAIKNLCFKNTAIFSRNSDLCGKISVENEKIECADILTASRVNKENILECAIIQTPLHFSSCVKNNPQDCALFENPDLANQCKDWRFFDNIIGNQEVKYCDILLGENFKKVCLAYFEKNKYKDSDADGLNDREELNYGTDAFVLDSEAKAQAESRRSVVDPVAKILRETRNKINLAISEGN